MRMGRRRECHRQLDVDTALAGVVLGRRFELAGGGPCRRESGDDAVECVTAGVLECPFADRLRQVHLEVRRRRERPQNRLAAARAVSLDFEPPGEYDAREGCIYV